MVDDAVHIAAPWEPRDSLCGQSDPANVAPFDGERPDGVAGCWTCLMAAKWMGRRLVCHDEAALERVAAFLYKHEYGDRWDGFTDTPEGKWAWDLARGVLTAAQGHDCPAHPRAGR